MKVGVYFGEGGVGREVGRGGSGVLDEVSRRERKVELLNGRDYFA